MKKLTYSLIFLLLLASCSTQKNLQIHQAKESVILQKEKDSAVERTLQVNTDKKVLETINTTESIDTVVHLGASEITGSSLVKDLLAGEHIYSESGSMILETFYDSVHKVIRSQAIYKPQDIRAQGTRIRQETRQVDEKQKKQESDKISIKTKDQEHRESVSLDKNKTVKRTGLPAWLIIMIILGVVVAIAVMVWRLKLF